MQISSKELIFLIFVITIIFLLAPIFLISYITVYNKKKAKLLEEKEELKKVFELELLKSQIEVQERLMQNIAGNLHDNIGQLLSLTSVTLSSIAAENPHQEKIKTAGELTIRAIRELRQLSKKMSAQELIRQNLGHAIAVELDWLEKGTEFKISFEDKTTHSNKECADKELILFRLFQEILSNIIKHAQASVITIILEQVPGLLSLNVKDNGKGFVLEEKIKEGSGMGLFNIGKRARMMNGTLSISSNPGSGTEILVSIPYL
jgi:signal transduction histidine kinase